MSEHNEMRQLISVYHDGAATSDEKELIQNHIKECEFCRLYMQEISKLSSSLKCWEDEDLSLDLEQNIRKKFFDLNEREGRDMKRNTTVITVALTTCVVVYCLVLIVIKPGFKNQFVKSVDRYESEEGLLDNEVNVPVYQKEERGIADLNQVKDKRKELVLPEEEVSMTKGLGIAGSRLESSRSGELGYLTKSQKVDAVLVKGDVVSHLETMPSTQRGNRQAVYDDISSKEAKLNRDSASSLSKRQRVMYEKEADIQIYKGGVKQHDGKYEESKGFKSGYGTFGSESSHELPPQTDKLKEDVKPFIQIFRETPEKSNPARLAKKPVGASRSVDMDLMDASQPFWGSAEPEIIEPIEDYPDEDYWPKKKTHDEEFNTEEYDRIYENEFLASKENPLSTFSIDVDTASYSNVRRYLNDRQMPPKDAVRIEEMINYFVYDYPQPSVDEPFSITTEVAACPWNSAHQLALVGLQGKELSPEEMVPSNLVFLIDVSGSMDNPDKLPLLKSAFRLFVEQLREEERVAIVTYAGSAGLVLDSTSGYQKQKILNAIDHLEAGGSTAGGEGIRLAYKIARQNFIENGNNRVILATDGDFNVGVSSDGHLTRLIEKKREEGIFLSILGFGTGNLKDSKMEKIADKGNGNYYYIDSIREAEKILVKELGSLLFTIAKDVKVQIEFNPNQVSAYRLIGYENRILAKEDFNDDTKDAGELGAGHTVTALYEIVPVGQEEEFGGVDPLLYQEQIVKQSSDIMNVKLRYKNPKELKSRLITKRVSIEDIQEDNLSINLGFSSSVAEFGLLLRDSKYKGTASYLSLLNRAREHMGEDYWGYRREFISLIEKAGLMNNSGRVERNDSYDY